MSNSSARKLRRVSDGTQDARVERKRVALVFGTTPRRPSRALLLQATGTRAAFQEIFLDCALHHELSRFELKALKPRSRFMNASSI